MTSGRLEDYHIGGAAADAQMRAAATPISFALVRVAEGAPSSSARGGTIDLEIIAEEAEIIRPKLDFNFAMTNAELEAATAAAAQSSLDADDVKDRLNASAREFVQWLYSGRAVISKNGAEARIGSVDGEAGSSLSIQLTGPRTGLWKDHATDDGGDLFTLYASYIGYDVRNDFVLVLQEIAKDFLGDKIEYERPKERPTPQAVIKAKKEKLGDKPRDEDSELLGVPSAIYQYLDLQNRIVARVMRYPLEGVDEHGKPRKTFRQYSFREVDGQTKWVARAPESNRPLYRLPQIAKMAAVVKPVMFSCRRFAPLVHKPGPVHPDFQNWNGTNIELRFCLGGGAFPPICAIPEWNHGPQLLPP